jgi:hypothetical protein
MVSLEHGLASLVWVALIILNFAPFEEVPVWIGFIQSFLQESHNWISSRKIPENLEFFDLFVIVIVILSRFAARNDML